MIALAEPQADNGKAAGLECPKCGCRDLRAMRTKKMPRRIMRQRRCRLCGRVVTSYEYLAGEKDC